MKIQYYRFFLNKYQDSLFKQNLSKRDFLLDILSKDYNFEKGKSKLAYKFNSKIDDFIYGKIGKEQKIKTYDSPENNFKIEEDISRPNINIFFKIDDNVEKGQLIGIENKSSIFNSTKTPLIALKEYINSMTNPYYLDFSPIPKQLSFWEILNDNRDKKLKKIEFSFMVPNLFQANNKLNEELESAKKQFNARRFNVDIQNTEEGLNTDKISDMIEQNSFVDQSTEYINNGGGEYKLKFEGKIYKSSDKIKQKTIEDFDIEIASSNPDVIKDVLNKIFE